MMVSFRRFVRNNSRHFGAADPSSVENTDERSADPKRLQLFLTKRLNETFLKIWRYIVLHSF